MKAQSKRRARGAGREAPQQPPPQIHARLVPADGLTAAAPPRETHTVISWLKVFLPF